VNLQGQHGIERLLQTILYTTESGNGFDAVGHYLRSQLFADSCLEYATKQDSTCSARFAGASASSASAASATAAPVSAPALHQQAAASPQTMSVPRASAPVAGSGHAPTSNGGAQAAMLGYLLGGGSGK